MAEPALAFVPVANRSKTNNQDARQAGDFISRAPLVLSLAKNYLLGRCSLTDTILVGLHQMFPGRAAEVIRAGKLGAGLAKNIPGAERMTAHELIKHPGFEWGVRGKAVATSDMAVREPNLPARYPLVPANPSRRQAATVTSEEQAGREVEASAYAPVATAGEAFHDGSESGVLGSGDQVFDGRNKVVQAFPSTPEGVVAAALYELHRGDNRSLASIIADNSRDKTKRGMKAAIEQKIFVTRNLLGNNTDPDDAQVIGGFQATKERPNAGSATPISSYLEAAQVHAPAQPWCGSFATFIYLRAGLKFRSMALTHTVPISLATSGNVQQRGLPAGYYRMTGIETKDKVKKTPATYDGQLEQGVYDKSDQKYQGSISVTSAKDLDVRVGDMFWQEHNSREGHAGIIIGLHKTDREIKMITIEGNASDQVRTRERKISVDENGNITSNIKGWGRPASLNGCVPPAQPEHEPQWIRDAHLNRGDRGGDR